MKKYLLAAVVAIAMLCSVAACDDAHVASQNLSRDADLFKINRRVIFYNGITGDYILTIEGFCSIQGGAEVRAVTAVCKTGPNTFKKHYLGISNNVTWFAEQLENANVSVDHYKVVFKPSVIIPDIVIK